VQVVEFLNCTTPPVAIPGVTDADGVNVIVGPTPTPTPTPTPGCDPGVDTDGDGFDNDVECYVGTDPLDDCPDDPWDDAWPFDNNVDTWSNVLDVLQYKGHLQICVPDPGYVQRLDINGDQCVNALDVLLYKGHLQIQCTNP
jgi:hypothetical protein